MKQWICAFLVISNLSFAATREENLEFILTKNYLNTQTEAMLNMFAMQAIAQSEKKIDASQLISQFENEFKKEKNLKKLFDSYAGVFSDEEVATLKDIYAAPVWNKYSQEGFKIAKVQLEIIQNIFADLAAEFDAEKRSDGSVVQMTKENLNLLNESKKPIILDISAEWCGACKAMEPIFSDLSEKYNDQIQFVKVDFDSQKELAEKFEVKSLPTFVFLKPNESKASMKNIGFLEKKEFEKKINEFLKD